MRPLSGAARPPALHRGVCRLPGRSSEPDHQSRRTFHPALRPARAAALARPGSILADADGPPGKPAERSADLEGWVTAPGSATMTPHEAPSSEPGCLLRSTASSMSQAACNKYFVARYLSTDLFPS